MSNHRKFIANSMSDDQVKDDILRDLRSQAGAQKNLTAAGSDEHLAFSRSIDQALDELNEAKAGTWRRNHT